MTLFAITPVGWILIALGTLIIVLGYGYLWYRKKEMMEITYEYFDAEVNGQKPNIGGMFKEYTVETTHRNLRRINGLHIWQVARRYWREHWVRGLEPYVEWEYLTNKEIQEVERAIEEGRQIILYFDQPQADEAAHRQYHYRPSPG